MVELQEQNTSTTFRENVHLEELTQEELEAHVESGLFYKVEDHKEHFAIHPFWLAQPRQGIIQELTKTLGKWNSRLQAYPVGFEKIKTLSNIAAMNADHRWFHLDVYLTFYLYKPEEGQELKGTIRKLGQKAAICIAFNVFSVTVYPLNEEEQSGWSLGDEIEFSVDSFQNRRKGPIIRAHSTSGYLYGSSTVKNKKTSFTEDWEVEEEVRIEKTKSKLDKSFSVYDETDVNLEDEDILSPKKKKKKKHKSHERDEELETSHECPPHKKKSKKRSKIDIDSDALQTESLEEPQDLIIVSSSKKKKKHKKRVVDEEDE